jgi:hypothetical protein
MPVPVSPPANPNRPATPYPPSATPPHPPLSTPHASENHCSCILVAQSPPPPSPPAPQHEVSVARRVLGAVAARDATVAQAFLHEGIVV